MSETKNELKRNECNDIGIKSNLPLTKKSKIWSKYELEFLRENHSNHSIKDTAKILNRSEQSIKNKAHKLGLQKQKGDWTPEELKILKENYAMYGSTSEMLNLLPLKSAQSIRRKAHKLHLKFDIRYKWIGRKFGRWTILERESIRPSNWRCQCDCGTVAIIALTTLLSEGSRSCGCLSIEKVKERRGCNSPVWKGFGLIRGYALARIKANAMTRRIEFNIDSEYLHNLFLGQNGRCALSGIELKLPQCDKDNSATASLDRIDSTKGYVVGNCQWVHKDINRMKWHFQQEHFIELCKQISNYKLI